MSMRHERAESIDLPRTPMAFAPNYRSEKDTDRVLAEGIDKRRVEDTKVELKKEKDQLLLVRKKRQSFPSSHSTSEDTSEDTETRSLASLDFTASKQTEGDDVFAESEAGDVTGRLSSDEPEETAAVNELLERYTTLFEKDATSQSPVQADNDALGGRTWIIT